MPVLIIKMEAFIYDQTLLKHGKEKFTERAEGRSGAVAVIWPSDLENNEISRIPKDFC